MGNREGTRTSGSACWAALLSRRVRKASCIVRLVFTLNQSPFVTLPSKSAHVNTAVHVRGGKSSLKLLDPLTLDGDLDIHLRHLRRVADRSDTHIDTSTTTPPLPGWRDVSVVRCALRCGGLDPSVKRNGPLRA